MARNQQRRERLLPADNDDQPLAPRHGGIKQVPLQRGVMLRSQRNDQDRILGALRLVNGRRVGEQQLVQFGEAVRHRPAIELDDHFRSLGIDLSDNAEAAVVDLLAVVVLDQHHSVAEGTRSSSAATKFRPSPHRSKSQR
jgi:hypothetical protein